MYYLPYSMACTSRDELDQGTAPLFLDTNQAVIRGDELKVDLTKPDAQSLASTLSVNEHLERRIDAGIADVDKINTCLG